MRFWLALCALWVLGSTDFLIAQTTRPSGATTAGKKLIQYGWDSPDTAYLRKNLKRIEASPFDGICLTVRPSPGAGKLGGMDALGWMVFSGKAFRQEQYQHAIDDLVAARSSKLTDNFIVVVSQPPRDGIDWFDDAAWKNVLENIRIMARIARAGRCAGIMFDPEEYAAPLWTYKSLPAAIRRQHSYAEHAAIARERGHEIAQAIAAEFPHATILSLYGPSLYAQQVSAAGKDRAAEAPYSLLGPFYDGIIDTQDGPVLVDGYEQSYGYRNEQQFVDARAQMIQNARAPGALPQQFQRQVRVGFGLWLDNQSGAKGGWFAADANKNYFTPQQWQSAVHFALEHSDKYVWIYNERARWWEGQPVGDDYLSATRRAAQRP